MLLDGWLGGWEDGRVGWEDGNEGSIRITLAFLRPVNIWNTYYTLLETFCDFDFDVDGKKYRLRLCNVPVIKLEVEKGLVPKKRSVMRNSDQ